MQTKSFEQVIENAEIEGLYGASVLLRFAADVFYADNAETSRWVVLRAIDRAEKELRDAVDCGDDMNVVDARMAAIRLRIGMGGVRDSVEAVGMADDESDSAVVRLRASADACTRLWFNAMRDA